MFPMIKKAHTKRFARPIKPASNTCASAIPSRLEETWLFFYAYDQPEVMGVSRLAQESSFLGRGKRRKNYDDCCTYGNFRGKMNIGKRERNNIKYEPPRFVGSFFINLVLMVILIFRDFVSIQTYPVVYSRKRPPSKSCRHKREPNPCYCQ